MRVRVQLVFKYTQNRTKRLKGRKVKKKGREGGSVEKKKGREAGKGK